MQLEDMSKDALIALVKLQEAALGAEQARYESLSQALAVPVPAASVQGGMVIGFPDPEAVFAQFCEIEGYPSDGDMDEALRKAFYEGTKLGHPAPSILPDSGRDASLVLIMDIVKLWDSQTVGADDYNEEMCRIEQRMRSLAAHPANVATAGQVQEPLMLRFERWAKSHGGLSLESRSSMENEKLPFPTTYWKYETEIAWRAFANSPHANVAQAGDGLYTKCIATIRDLDRISMEFAAGLVALPSVEGSCRSNLDYLIRDDVLKLVTAWRAEWDKNSSQRMPIDRAAMSAPAK